MDGKEDLKKAKCLECGKTGTLVYLGHSFAVCKECGETYECEGTIEVPQKFTTEN